jgi:hypothetical protein
MQWQWGVKWERRGRDRMVVGFITTYAISANYHPLMFVSLNLNQGEVYTIMW